MAETTVGSTNIETIFDSKVIHEYVRGGRFGPHTGNTENAIIQVNNNLNKKSIPLITKLSGAGVKGSTSLVGNEEALSDYAMTFNPTYWRNGVTIDNEENEKSSFELKQEARPALMNWAMEKKRDHIIQAMGAIQASGTNYSYGGTEYSNGATAASAGNMDTWQAANTDRILYGKLISNLTSGNHTTSLATIDNTDDKCTAAHVDLLKTMAELANPIIRPVMLKGDEPWYVLYVGSYAFRDLRADLADDWQNAMPRTIEGNPLFSGGDIVTNGVIVKRIPEIENFIDGTSGIFGGVWGTGAADSLAAGGALGIRTGIGFLCGAQAVCFGLGKPASIKRRKEDDYEHLSGVGISMKHDIVKIFFNNKQHGMVTSFHASVK